MECKCSINSLLAETNKEKERRGQGGREAEGKRKTGTKTSVQTMLKGCILTYGIQPGNPQRKIQNLELLYQKTTLQT